MPGMSAGARAALGATIHQQQRGDQREPEREGMGNPRSIGTVASSSARARRELEVEQSRGKEAAHLVSGGYRLEVRE